MKKILLVALAGCSCALAMERSRDVQQADMPFLQLGYTPVVPREESADEVLKDDERCGYCCCCAATMLSMFGCGMHWGAIAVSEAGYSGISTALTGLNTAICSALCGFGCLLCSSRLYQEYDEETDIPLWQVNVIVPPSRMDMNQ